MKKGLGSKARRRLKQRLAKERDRESDAKRLAEASSLEDSEARGREERSIKDETEAEASEEAEAETKDTEGETNAT